jgi:hypothetical protein
VTSGPAAAISSGIHALEEARDKGGYVLHYRGKRELVFVIWEIILRDSWGAILRALLTRSLNLRPIAVQKSSIIYWLNLCRSPRSKGAIGSDGSP